MAKEKTSMKKIVTDLPQKPKYPPVSPIQLEGEQDENITKDAAWYLKSKYGFEK